MFILDTNILSAIMSARPSPEVAAWIAGKQEDALFTTTICQAEILTGLAVMRKGRRVALETAAQAIFADDFNGRVLPIAPGAGTRPPRKPCDNRAAFVHLRQHLKSTEGPDMEAAQKFTADHLTFVVRHELWDENIQDHADQGVSIDVKARVGGKDTTLLRFNCFDIEKSYVYGPENDHLAVAGPEMLGGTALTNLYRMDPIACGNPIGWTIKTLGTKLSKMLDRAGYPAVAALVDYDAVRDMLPQVEACARELYATKRNTVKHNRGTDIFEAGNIRFGLEMRRLAMGDGGLAIHVLADIGGTPDKHYTEETELLAFDHFWNGAHYHYGPRNKNHRIYWDRTLVENPLAWTLEQFETGKLPAMIVRAGYPGIAADLDTGKIAEVLPAMKKRALEMWEEGERLTGHPGLPLEPTPNLAAAE